MFSRLFFVSCLLLSLFSPALCAAQTATCTNWKFFTGGQANAINRWSTVVGVAPKGVQQTLYGYLRWSNGSSSTYMAPKASGTSFSRRNAQGVTVGFAYTSKGTEGLVLSGSKAVYVDYPHVANTVLEGINYWGSIVGNGDNNTQVQNAFELKDGKFTSIAYPSAVSTHVSSISDKAVIVGYYLDSNFVRHGFVLQNGVYKTLDNPNADPDSADGTNLTDINSSGTITGFYYQGSIAHAFIYSNGIFKEVARPDINYTFVGGINGYGDVTGTTNFNSGGYTSFTAHCQ